MKGKVIIILNTLHTMALVIYIMHSTLKHLKAETSKVNIYILLNIMINLILPIIKNILISGKITTQLKVILSVLTITLKI